MTIGHSPFVVGECPSLCSDCLRFLCVLCWFVPSFLGPAFPPFSGARFPSFSCVVSWIWLLALCFSLLETALRIMADPEDCASPSDSGDGSQSKTTSQVGDLLSLASQIPGQGPSGTPTSVPPGFDLNASSVPPGYELSTWVPAAGSVISVPFFTASDPSLTSSVLQVSGPPGFSGLSSYSWDPSLMSAPTYALAPSASGPPLGGVDAATSVASFPNLDVSALSTSRSQDADLPRRGRSKTRKAGSKRSRRDAASLPTGVSRALGSSPPRVTGGVVTASSQCEPLSSCALGSFPPRVTGGVVSTSLHSGSFPPRFSGGVDTAASLGVTLSSSGSLGLCPPRVTGGGVTAASLPRLPATVNASSSFPPRVSGGGLTASSLYDLSASSLGSFPPRVAGGVVTSGVFPPSGVELSRVHQGGASSSSKSESGSPSEGSSPEGPRSHSDESSSRSRSRGRRSRRSGHEKHSHCSCHSKRRSRSGSRRPKRRRRHGSSSHSPRRRSLGEARFRPDMVTSHLTSSQPLGANALVGSGPWGSGVTAPPLPDSRPPPEGFKAVGYVSYDPRRPPKGHVTFAQDPSGAPLSHSGLGLAPSVPGLAPAGVFSLHPPLPGARAKEELQTAFLRHQRVLAPPVSSYPGSSSSSLPGVLSKKESSSPKRKSRRLSPSAYSDISQASSRSPSPDRSSRSQSPPLLDPFSPSVVLGAQRQGPGALPPHKGKPMPAPSNQEVPSRSGNSERSARDDTPHSSILREAIAAMARVWPDLITFPSVSSFASQAEKLMNLDNGDPFFEVCLCLFALQASRRTSSGFCRSGPSSASPRSPPPSGSALFLFVSSSCEDCGLERSGKIGLAPVFPSGSAG